MTEQKPIPDKDLFKMRAEGFQQNLVLALLENVTDPDEKVRICCRAGISDLDVLASLLGRPMGDRDKDIMFRVLMWGESNPVSLAHQTFYNQQKREFFERLGKK